VSDEEVEEVLKHVRELVARNQRLLLENTRLCEQVNSDDDAKVLIREFRTQCRELLDRIIQMRTLLKEYDREDWRDPFSIEVPVLSRDGMDELLADMQALLEGED